MKEIPACPVETAIMLIGNKWKALIVLILLDGTKRFSEIKKEMGSITQKVLTSNLRELEDDGLLMRKIYAQVPPKVEYTLTPIGYSLKQVLDALELWGKEYQNCKFR